MVKIRQKFPRPVLGDIPQTVKQELNQLKTIHPGQKIGITVGSRGIQNIKIILQVTIDYIKNLGAEPVLLAAMGSHGSGTAAGQKEVLDSLGITEEALGVSIVTCDINEIIGQTEEGLTAYVLKSALEVDGILVINRIKTHTSFKGDVESGLVKALVVGLGGPRGARQFHSYGSSKLSHLLLEIGQVMLNKLPIIGGLGLIENGYEETVLIQAIAREEFIAKEKELLRYSKTLMPSLPAETMDLLVIQEMGKNYSGTGIDSNIIGRIRIQGEIEPDSPKIKCIAVLDISEASHGNATGIGLADFTTKRLVDKIDRKATYLNCLTSTFYIKAFIPMYFDSEQKIFEAALLSLSGIKPEKLKIIIIPNTLFLSEMYVSEGMVAGLSTHNEIEVLGNPVELTFDHEEMQLKIK
jgi:hypothetical protein